MTLRAADGVEGVGEATLFGRERALAAALEAERGLWLGRPADPEAVAARPLPAALPAAAVRSAVEQAAWDAHGRRRGAPLADLLGRRRDAVPVYANVNRRTRDRTPEGFAGSAMAAVAAGHGAVKLAPFDEVGPRDGAFGEARAGLARIAAVRAAVPSHVAVLVDCHWRFAPSAAERAAEACAERGVSWFECPIVEEVSAIPELKRLRALANRLGMALAGLEEQIGAAAFVPYLDAGAYDVIMPDVKYVGGLSETLKLAALARGSGASVAPHNPSGPIAHAASLAVAAALPELHSLELQFDESPVFEELLEAPIPPVRDGATTPFAGTGHGGRLRAEVVRRHAAAA